MKRKIKILILEDVLSDLELILLELKESKIKFEHLHVETEEDFRNAFVEYNPDLILSDYMLPQFTGMEALEIVREIFPTLPFIVITGSMNEEVAVECMKAGASDYVIKEHLGRLNTSIINAFEKQKSIEAKIQAENALRQRIKELNVLHNLSIISDISDTFEEYAEGILDLIPEGFSYPDKTWCRLKVEEKNFQTANYSPCENKVSFDIHQLDRKAGNIEVGLLDSGSQTDSGTFLPEERELLITIAKNIGEYINRKKVEKELHDTLEKALESDRLKSAFLDTISHEFRTPLNAVIGFSQLIERETELDDILEFVSHINKGGNHLLGIVEDILNISVIESGNLKVKMEDYSLSSILEEVRILIETEQAKIQKQHIGILYTPPVNDPDLWITTDGEKLTQILMNLLKNALKFTDEGSIEFGYIPEHQQDKPFLKFFVKDTGIGIPEKMQHFIFDIFRQADETHTRTHGGTGIGLAITKKLLTLMGGTIWVESKEGKGSVFYFTLPFKGSTHETQVGKQVIPEVVPDYSGQKVLVAEDEESNFELLDILLSSLNLNVVWAKNGREAVQLCSEDPDISLVLMDLKMPVLDGYKATRIIRESHPHLPIIAQTAFAMPADRDEAIEAGCNDVVVKPIEKVELFTVIEKCLG